MNVFQVWSPWLVRQAVDHVQAGVSRATLARDAGLILLAVCLQGLFLYAMRMTLIRTSRRMEYELRNDLFDHLARLPASVYLGLPVTSHNNTLLATATFDNVSIVTAGAPPPPNTPPQLSAIGNCIAHGNVAGHKDPTLPRRQLHQFE